MAHRLIPLIQKMKRASAMAIAKRKNLSSHSEARMMNKTRKKRRKTERKNKKKSKSKKN